MVKIQNIAVQLLITLFVRCNMFGCPENVNTCKIIQGGDERWEYTIKTVLAGEDKVSPTAALFFWPCGCLILIRRSHPLYCQGDCHTEQILLALDLAEVGVAFSWLVLHGHTYCLLSCFLFPTWMERISGVPYIQTGENYFP